MRLPIKQLGWRIFSLVSAATLWYLLVGETETSASVPVLVQYRHLPPELEVTSEPPERIFLKLRGPTSRLKAEDLSSIPLFLDLGNAHAPGEQTITITERELGLPPGVSLMRAVPSQVRVTLDRRAEKLVPVEVQYSGPPPSGYRIATQRVFPARVRVTGPETVIAGLEAAMTDRIDLSSTVSNGEFRVAVSLGDSRVRLESGTQFVKVQVSLERIRKP